MQLLSSPSATVSGLRAGYASGALRPTDVVAELTARIDARGDDHVWISRTPADELHRRARELEGLDPAGHPLWGVPVAVKDNIDAVGLPTTAACPAFTRTPEAEPPRSGGCARRARSSSGRPTWTSSPPV